MAEAITEMIIPSTYIEVRAEGLIGVSGIAVGNVGIVGTASKGPVGEAVALSAFVDARDSFGDYDGWAGGASNELTLLRALQQAFNNGASTVYAVRAASAGVAAAVLALTDSAGSVATLTAKTKGTWGNDVRAQVRAASENGFVEKRTQRVGAGALAPLHANIASSPRNVVRISRGTTGQTFRLQLATTGTASRGKVDRKSTRLNSSHIQKSRMPSSA